MRSRFSAFALDRHDYLLASWHPSTRPDSIEPNGTTQWMRLEILGSETQGDSGNVHFRATFREARRWQVLEENSRFVREDGRWYYLDGVPSVMRFKPGRNDPCPCGSQRKLKSCCGR